MRRIKIAGIVLSSLSLFGGVCLVGASSASATAAAGTATVTPLTGIRSGTHLTITGSGWAPNAQIAITECLRGATDASGCDTNFSHLTLAATTASGQIPANTTYTAYVGAVGGHSCGTASSLNSCDVSVGYADPTSHSGLVFNITFAAPLPPAKHTITCTKKHKPNKMVTAVKPVCPAGYKIKK